VHESADGTSQPWQLPRRTAGHGSKADAGAQPLTEREQRIAELEQEIERLRRIGEVEWAIFSSG
jgi:hypothetical protein